MSSPWSGALASSTHESGHVVIARYFDIAVALSKIRNDGSGVSMIQSNTDDVDAEVRLVVKLSGHLAEAKYVRSVGLPNDPGLRPAEGSHSDEAEAFEIAIESADGDEGAALRFVEIARQRANYILDNPKVWAAVELFAAELSTRRQIAGPDINVIVDPMISGVK